MAYARAQMRVKYENEAREQFAKLGVEPTAMQVEQAGDALLKAAQRERMALARASRHLDTQAERRVKNMEWGLRQVERAAYDLHTWAPEVSEDKQFLVALMVLGDEVRSPDGFNRKRLGKRLDALVAYVKAQAGQRSAQLEATLPEPFLSVPVELPDLGDILDGLQPGTVVVELREDGYGGA
jgi:hypothetical protein